MSKKSIILREKTNMLTLQGSRSGWKRFRHLHGLTEKFFLKILASVSPALGTNDHFPMTEGTIFNIFAPVVVRIKLEPHFLPNSSHSKPYLAKCIFKQLLSKFIFKQSLVLLEKTNILQGLKTS